MLLAAMRIPGESPDLRQDGGSWNVSFLLSFDKTLSRSFHARESAFPLEHVLSQPSLYPPSVQFADINEELAHLFGLVDIEMSLLGESAGRLGSTQRMGLPLKTGRDLLPWKRGKTVVADFAKLGAHCARIAELMPLIEAEQEKPVATPTPAADTEGTPPPTPTADPKADAAPVSEAK